MEIVVSQFRVSGDCAFGVRENLTLYKPHPVSRAPLSISVMSEGSDDGASAPVRTLKQVQSLSRSGDVDVDL
jgi:hypothetical protein